MFKDRLWRWVVTTGLLVTTVCGGQSPNVTVLTSASGRIRIEIDPEMKGYNGDPDAFERSFKELGVAPPELRIRVVGPNAAMKTEALAATC